MISGAGLPAGDPGIRELAALLHRHVVGALTITSAADTSSFRALLNLLSRPPDEIREAGGIARLWAAEAKPGLEVRELDYAHVLRDTSGGATTVEAILAAALAGGDLDLNEETLQSLLALIRDPAKLDELMNGLDTGGAETNPDGRSAVIMNLLRTIVTEAQQLGSEALETTLTELGKITARLSADEMLYLIAQRTNRTPDGDIAGAVLARMDDNAIAQFIAGSVANAPGATGRLAHAFQALVPDDDRRRHVLGMAEDKAAGDLGQDASFQELRERVQSMVSTYSDASYVSDDYAQELFKAQTRATEIERTHDDPPDRINAWLATVNDDAVRRLDQQLLMDLLAVEPDLSRWGDIADTVMRHAEELAREGRFDASLQLVGKALTESELQPERRDALKPLLQRLVRGPMLKEIAAFLRTADDRSGAEFNRVCAAVGPPVIPQLAEMLSGEKDARARRRLRDTLVSFGAQGREGVQKLMGSASWEVRRTAATLLREFGGAEGIRELLPLLGDAEPLVQREAIHGLVAGASADAAAILLEALDQASDTTRLALGKELTSLRDPKAAPLLCHVAAQIDRRRYPDLYLSVLEALGPLKDDLAVTPLETALRASEWWAPGRAKRMRAIAAASLRRIGSERALEALKSAAASGGRGTRAAALAELSQLH